LTAANLAAFQGAEKKYRPIIRFPYERQNSCRRRFSSRAFGALRWPAKSNDRQGQENARQFDDRKDGELLPAFEEAIYDGGSREL